MPNPKTPKFDTIPTAQELLYFVFQQFVDQKPHHCTEFIDIVIQKYNLDPDLMANPVFNGRNNNPWSSGRRLVLDRVYWARTFLFKANLLDRTARGYYKINQRGQKLVDDKIIFSEAGELIQIYPDLMQDPFWNVELRVKKDKNMKSQVVGFESETSTLSDISPDEQLKNILFQSEAQVIDELTAQINEISPRGFEFLVVKLLVAMGYGTEEFSSTTSYTNDGGIDGIVQADELGFDRIYIQAKKYSGNVGRPDLQKFVGAMNTTNKGIFITTSDFAPSVKDYLKTRQENIVLINGQKLAELMYKYNQGVSVRQIIEIKGIDTDYFEELL
jgi:restriction system protein